MYPIPSTEKLVETKICRHCQTSFPITDKDLEFYDKVSPTFAGKKYLIPTPTLCPDCRQQRRLSFRNERKLYKRKCDATGKDIISIYSPDKPYKVYHQDIWWSDNWDPMDYGKAFDFGRGFFEQLKELMRRVPVQALSNKSYENSEYGNLNTDVKNCYLSFSTGYSEDCAYLTTAAWCKNTMEGFLALNSENSYEIMDSNFCYWSAYIRDSEQIRNSRYIVNCKNVADSIMCVNIRGGKNWFLNQQLTEKDYLIVRSKIFSDANFLKESLGKFTELIARSPFPNAIIGSTDCIGGCIKNSVSCTTCFDCIECSHCKYCPYIWLNATNCYDCGCDVFQTDCALESSIIPYGYRIAFSYNCWNSSETYFSFDSYSSSHLFWCIGLRNKQYCIFNKQYTKEEYEELVPRIIEHMMTFPLAKGVPEGRGLSAHNPTAIAEPLMQGATEWWEFFPSSLSPFWYNETVAQEYYPLTKEQATKDHIFNWSDYEAPFPKVEKIIPASKLPQDIKDIPDDILNWAIECEVTKKPFRIIKQELEFYRKHNLPIPKRHPDQRHLDRMAQRNPRKLFERKCDCCHKDMITTYAPERLERVYCEECYNQEVIG